MFNSKQKELGRHDFRIIPNGVNGVEERLHIVWDEMVNSGLRSLCFLLSFPLVAAPFYFINALSWPVDLASDELVMSWWSIEMA